MHVANMRPFLRCVHSTTHTRYLEISINALEIRLQ